MRDQIGMDSSIVQAATAVPAFIGYTEKAVDPEGWDLAGKPWRVSSMAEYRRFFGGAPPRDQACFGRYLLYCSMQLFFQNGGGACLIVSAGPYSDTGSVAREPFELALTALAKEPEPTMVVMPEAALLDEGECLALQASAIRHCAIEMRNRVAILDVWEGCRDDPNAALDSMAKLRNLVDGLGLSYASAYFPWLNATGVQDGALLPPSAAIAGMYTTVDKAHGVWKAPANVSLIGVSSSAVTLSDEQHKALAGAGGVSINTIRTFEGEGPLVCAARTLDGNSLDWRYINVRRTLIMLEESIRLGAQAMVFEPNAADTWVTLKSRVSNFLTDIWKQGGLAGARSEEAFSVHCGLGDTMTADDILEGILRVTVLVAVVHPAEFIELTFQQQMRST
jgi:phage tail sheath protein FI